ncbi:MAG: hypothetical protein M3139_06325, partial [Bacteroidota bacterium]|nr:hypothetical protein [Bacteroidota bacterium]
LSHNRILLLYFHFIKRFINIFNVDHLNMRKNIKRSAKVQHFLSFSNAANHGTGRSSPNSRF